MIELGSTHCSQYLPRYSKPDFHIGSLDSSAAGRVVATLERPQNGNLERGVHNTRRPGCEYHLQLQFT